MDALAPPRTLWVMVPAGSPTRQTIERLAGVLEVGDVVVDGGNSRYTDSLDGAEILASRGIGSCDVGVSGGRWGLEEGYCLMVGAEEEMFARLEPIFAAMAPDMSGTVSGRVAADVASWISTAALDREESRGSHFRADLPHPDPRLAHRRILDPALVPVGGGP